MPGLATSAKHRRNKKQPYPFTTATGLTTVGPVIALEAVVHHRVQGFVGLDDDVHHLAQRLAARPASPRMYCASCASCGFPRLGSRLVLTTTEREYVESALLSEDAGGHPEVLKALALVKADRYATAADFVQGLTAQVGPSRRVVPKLAAGLALLLAAGAGALLWPHLHRPIGTAVATRLAVLPFENLGDSTDAYFADGMSDEVRGKLTTLHNLVVIGRASSVQYRKVRKSPTEIGRELGVAYLLTGTVRWEKHRDGTSQVHVSPELIRASDAVATWEQPFDASLTDVFQVQAAIATRVAEALNVALGATDQARLAMRPTDNLQAYDDYLQGEEISDRLGAVTRRRHRDRSRSARRGRRVGRDGAGIARIPPGPAIRRRAWLQRAY